MAVSMLDPRYDETLLDPACGTGGFLITAMNSALLRSHENNYLAAVMTNGTRAGLGHVDLL